MEKCYECQQDVTKYDSIVFCEECEWGAFARQFSRAFLRRPLLLSLSRNPRASPPLTPYRLPPVLLLSQPPHLHCSGRERVLDLPLLPPGQAEGQAALGCAAAQPQPALVPGVQ